ncbi:MAG: S8 family serine peptidase [Elusimicrobia bacterium]|nr:S8 family serine peptidase [Elusimicrobiota bacterium]
MIRVLAALLSGCLVLPGLAQARVPVSVRVSPAAVRAAAPMPPALVRPGIPFASSLPPAAVLTPLPPVSAAEVASAVGALGFVAQAAPGVPAAPAAEAKAELDRSWEGSIRRIVVFDPETSRETRLDLVRQAGWTVIRDLWLVNAVAVSAPARSAAELGVDLMASPEVARVEEDARVDWVPEKPQPERARRGLLGWWWQTVPWGVKRLHAPEAWPVTRGAGIKVAVVDTGVARHRDLKLAGGASFVAGEEWWQDGRDHGTHVAGIIAAQDNDQDVVGGAPDVELYSVKVLDKDGKGTFESVIAGLQWCVERGMHLANFSITHPTGNDVLAAAVKAAAAAGLVMVAAAGNTARAVQFPAAYPEVIAVAAATSWNSAADFSSFGPEIDIIAPGVGIPSTVAGGGTGKKQGTSMASPHVTGLAALALAAARGLLRGYAAVRRALQAAATKLPDTPDTWQGAGMPDARKLVGFEIAVLDLSDNVSSKQTNPR